MTSSIMRHLRNQEVTHLPKNFKTEVKKEKQPCVNISDSDDERHKSGSPTHGLGSAKGAKLMLSHPAVNSLVNYKLSWELFQSKSSSVRKFERKIR